MKPHGMSTEGCASAGLLQLSDICDPGTFLLHPMAVSIAKPVQQTRLAFRLRNGPASVSKPLLKCHVRFGWPGVACGAEAARHNNPEKDTETELPRAVRTEEAGRRRRFTRCRIGHALLSSVLNSTVKGLSALNCPSLKHLFLAAQEQCLPECVNGILLSAAGAQHGAQERT